LVLGCEDRQTEKWLGRQMPPTDATQCAKHSPRPEETAQDHRADYRTGGKLGRWGKFGRAGLVGCEDRHTEKEVAGTKGVVTKRASQGSTHATQRANFFPHSKETAQDHSVDYRTGGKFGRWGEVWSLLLGCEDRHTEKWLGREMSPTERASQGETHATQCANHFPRSEETAQGHRADYRTGGKFGWWGEVW
jgi:hypothetical protein